MTADNFKGTKHAARGWKCPRCQVGYASEGHPCYICYPKPKASPTFPGLLKKARAVENELISSATAAIGDWRVGWFWSSSNPDQCVRVLAEGKQIAEYEERDDFISWIN